MPTPMLRVASRSAGAMPPSCSTMPNTGWGAQVERSMLAVTPVGSDLARLAASPPPVMCAIA
jgi:hypothetical protein